MNQEDINSITKRQDGAAREVEMLQLKMEQMEFEMAELLHKLTAEEMNHQYFPKSKIKTPLDALKKVSNQFINNHEQFKQVVTKLKTFPEYVLFEEKQKEYDAFKYNYYDKLFSYFSMIEEDRKKWFGGNYKNMMIQLAEKGIMLFYMQTPDAPLEHFDLENAEKFIISSLTYNNYEQLSFLLKHIFENINGYNSLKDSKINDLKEALTCLINGAYQSCARTMFGLLENEHTNASDLINQCTMDAKIREIDNKVKAMGSAYYLEVWEHLNKYYKKLNCNTKDMAGTIINRHDLAHGAYKRKVLSEDCIKLFLLFLSFKDLSFRLQEIIIENRKLLK